MSSDPTKSGLFMHVDDDKPVGYGNPPEHTRFKKGQSGNPKGRRRKKLELFVWEDPIRTLLRRELSVSVNGKLTKMRAFHALLNTLLKKALQGDMRAMQMLFDKSNALALIIDEEKRKATEADEAFLVQMRKEAGEWTALYDEKCKILKSEPTPSTDIMTDATNSPQKLHE
jgi:hypothetical protein